MPRPRLPAQKAKINGAVVINAGRFKDRKAPKVTRSIGEPYVTMTPEQQDAWRGFTSEIPWLNGSHRALLRAACILRVRMEDPDVGVSQIQVYSAILSKLGASPSDETKVSSPDGEDSDPADQFFSRPN